MARCARILPPRWPPGGWPAVMRSDMAAAFFDCKDTKALFDAVRRGDCPQPSALRGNSSQREPVWFRADCEAFLAGSPLSSQPQSGPDEDLAALV